METIAVIGEAVADAVARTPDASGALRLDVRPGGSPANTAVGLARLGAPTRYFGRLSQGVLGRTLRAHLETSGVDLSGAVSASQQATLAIAALDERGRAGYDFYVDGTADWQWSAGELAGAGTASTIHTGSLALVRAPGDAVILDCLRGNRDSATISIDPNVRPGFVSPQRYRRGLDEWAGVADILKVSQDDLEHTHPGRDHRELCERWHALGCRLVVVTLGGQGAVASFDGEQVRVGARSIATADTIGAGDAFTAGLLYRLTELGHHGGRLDRLDSTELHGALELAAEVAARTCEVPGADPPWAGQLALTARRRLGRNRPTAGPAPPQHDRRPARSTRSDSTGEDVLHPVDRLGRQPDPFGRSTVADLHGHRGFYRDLVQHDPHRVLHPKEAAVHDR